MDQPLFAYFFICPECRGECVLYSSPIPGYMTKYFLPPAHPHCSCNPGAEMQLSRVSNLNGTSNNG